MNIPLIETVSDYRDRFEVIVEDYNGKPRKYLEGIYAQSERWNANDRWYQRSEFLKEMERFNKDIIPNRKALGELDHSVETQVLLHRASHIFEDALRMEGNDLVGRARVMDTGYGQTLAVLIDEKIPFGVSSKGMGSLSKYKKDGKQGNLVSGFQMRSPGDVVYNQSAPDAVPKAIIEMIMEYDQRMDAIWGTEVLDESRKRIRSINEYELKTKISDEFKRLINK